MNRRGLLAGGSATLLSGLGLVHMVATAWFYTTMSVDALWFAGSGLAILLLGLLNLLRLRGRDPLLCSVGIFTNLLGTLFLLLLSFVLRAPQAWVSLALMLLLLADSLLARYARKSNERESG